MLQILRIVLVTSLTALGAFVAMPLPYLVWGAPALPGAIEALSWRSLSLGLFYPSAQLIGAWLAGTWLGPRAAAFAMVLYLGLGAFGLPVFIDGGGVDYSRHSAVLPLLGFPVAAFMIARLRGDGRGRRTFFALLLATLMVSTCAVVSGVIGTGAWADWRQWAVFSLPHAQALGGWVGVMILWAMASDAVARWRRLTAPARPSTPPPAPEEAASETRRAAPLALPSGRPRDQRALPPAIAPNTKQLPAPKLPRPPH